MDDDTKDWRLSPGDATSAGEQLSRPSSSASGPSRLSPPADPVSSTSSSTANGATGAAGVGSTPRSGGGSGSAQGSGPEPLNAAQQLSKRKRGHGVVTPTACTECRKKRAKVWTAPSLAEPGIVVSAFIPCALRRATSPIASQLTPHPLIV